MAATRLLRLLILVRIYRYLIRSTDENYYDFSCKNSVLDGPFPPPTCIRPNIETVFLWLKYSSAGATTVQRLLPGELCPPMIYDRDGFARNTSRGAYTWSPCPSPKLNECRLWWTCADSFYLLLTQKTIRLDTEHLYI